MNIKERKNSGVALLMSLAILSLLAVLGTAFATGMRLGQRTSRDFMLNIQARYIAEAGIQRTIAELKYHPQNGVVSTFEDSRGEYWWYGEKYGDQNGNGIPYENLAGTDLENTPQVSLGSSAEGINLGNYTAHYFLKIVDTASQINVNDTDNGNLSAVLGYLCSYLGSPLTSRDASRILSRTPYYSKYDVKNAFDSDNNGDLTDTQEAKYNLIKDFITINSYEDPNNNNKAMINVDSASWQVIASVLRPLLGGNASRAGSAARNLCNAAMWNNVPVTYPGWANFKWGLENYTPFLSDTERQNIFNSVNPNRDLNGDNDTKCGFNSGGYYEIECLAHIRDTRDNLVAKKRISATIKIFDQWNQTTREEFRQVWENDNSSANSGDIEDGEIVRATWFDSCPVNSNENWQLRTVTNYTTINDSMKIGYWDDFDEETDDYYNFSIGQAGEWKDLANSSSIHLSRISSGGNNLLNVQGPNGNVMLADSNKWNFGNSALTIWENDNPENPRDWWWDVGWFIFRWQPGSDDSIFHGVNTDTPPDPNLDELLLQIQGYGWISPEHIYDANKIYRIIQNEGFLSWNVDYNLDGAFDFGSSASVSRSNINGRVKLLMMGNNFRAAQWDNLRVIPDTGYYISTPSNAAYNPLNIPEPFNWGMLWATVTMPDSVPDAVINSGDVAIKLQYSTDNGENWSDKEAVTVEVSPGVWRAGIPITTTGQSIQYRANFYSTYSDNNQYSETPVLEDVWVTYLPRTRVVYWKEGE